MSLLGGQKSFSQSVCISFFTQGYSGGNQPRSITSADFNHDGHLDLAMGNFETSTISTLFGAGNGTFAGPINYSCGTYPNDITTADLNNDGNPDLVTANQGGNSVSVFLGSNNGLFSDSVNYLTNAYVDAVTIEDVTNDSVPDILTANEAGGTISCLAGNGDGTFQSAINSPTLGGCLSVYVADFNNDGWEDVLYCHFPGLFEVLHYFSVLFGDGSGTFANEQQTTVINVPLDAIASDVNHDGFMDAITADYHVDTASVYLGNGDGTFNFSAGYPAGIGPNALAYADINNDSIADIVVADYGGNGIAVLPGLGDGTFGDGVQEGGVVNPQSLTTGDFNEDGRPDIASSTTYFGSAYYAILLNCTVTGVDVNPTENSIDIFPNPVSESLTIRFEGAPGYRKILVTNVLGQEIFSKQVSNSDHSILINTSEWNNGIYVVTLQERTLSSTKKICKQ